jgi:predicted ATP-grasp superfamily ATP-dependent carboligase
MNAPAAVVLGMFETGLAVGRSLGRAGIKVLGLDSRKKVGFYSRYIDASNCPDPLEREEGFINFLTRVAERENDRPVLFVTSDEFIPAVSRNRSLLERHYHLNLPDSRIVECVTDKFRQHKLASEAGVPVPQPFVAGSMEDLNGIEERIPFPAFIKGAEVTTWRKAMGVASKGYPVSSRGELEDALKGIFGRGARALIQEIIPGPDTNHFKASCYLSRNGEVLLAFGLQKIRQQPVGFGFGCLVQSIEYPELLELGKSFFTKIGYRGVGSAEFKLDSRDGKLKLIELNPRYWQQNALAERCGMNFPLTDFLEQTGCEPKPVVGYRTGVKWVNIYSDLESFREYRQRGALSFGQWLRSLNGEIVFSDLSGDDWVPGVREILVQNVFRRPGRYLTKFFRSPSLRTTTRR